MTIIEKLPDLIYQGTTTRSSFHAVAVCRDAINEIIRLKLEVERLSEYKWQYEDARR